MHFLYPLILLRVAGGLESISACTAYECVCVCMGEKQCKVLCSALRLKALYEFYRKYIQRFCTHKQIYYVFLYILLGSDNGEMTGPMKPQNIQHEVKKTLRNK